MCSNRNQIYLIIKIYSRTADYVSTLIAGLYVSLTFANVAVTCPLQMRSHLVPLGQLGSAHAQLSLLLDLARKWRPPSF